MAQQHLPGEAPPLYYGERLLRVAGHAAGTRSSRGCVGTWTWSSRFHHQIPRFAPGRKAEFDELTRAKLMIPRKVEEGKVMLC